MNKDRRDAKALKLYLEKPYRDDPRRITVVVSGSKSIKSNISMGRTKTPLISRAYKTSWPTKVDDKKKIAGTIRGALLITRVRYNGKLYSLKKKRFTKTKVRKFRKVNNG